MKIWQYILEADRAYRRAYPRATATTWKRWWCDWFFGQSKIWRAPGTLGVPHAREPRLRSQWEAAKAGDSSHENMEVLKFVATVVGPAKWMTDPEFDFEVAHETLHTYVGQLRIDISDDWEGSKRLPNRFLTLEPVLEPNEDSPIFVREHVFRIWQRAFGSLVVPEYFPDVCSRCGEELPGRAEYCNPCRHRVWRSDQDKAKLRAKWKKQKTLQRARGKTPGGQSLKSSRS